MKKLKFRTDEYLDLNTFEEISAQLFSSYEEKFDKTPSLVRASFIRTLNRWFDREYKELVSLNNQFDIQIRNINSAKKVSELADIHNALNKITGEIFLNTKSVIELHRRCTTYRDLLTLKITSITRKQMESTFGKPNNSFAWIRMGSAGREEQTLMSDQDNLLVYKNKDDKHFYKEFSFRMSDNLAAIGISKCKGNIMPTNDKWFGTFSEWQAKLHTYIAESDNLVDLIVLTDAKYGGGNYSLGKAFIEETRKVLKTYHASFKAIAKATVLMPVALTIFRNFKTEKKGEYKDMLNIKSQGWLPLVMITLLFTYENEITETNTIKRIKELVKINRLESGFSEDLMESYFVLNTYKILAQIDALNKKTNTVSYFINPYKMDKPQQDKLRWSLSIVDKFQKMAAASYSISEDAL